MNELTKKYDELYEIMATSKDPKKMIIFGDAEKWMFHELSKEHPELAEIWLYKLESGSCNNYLSESEAKHIVDSFMEKQGSNYVQRYEWDFPTMKSAVESIGGHISEKPYYNCWALWATMNMLHSDHSETINAFIQPSGRIKFYYKMAVDKLKDFDRPHFVREYFDLD